MATIPTLPSAPPKEELIKVYRHSLPSGSYVFKDGRKTEFIAHLTALKDPDQIREMDAEIAAGNMFISLGSAEDHDMAKGRANPLEYLRNKFFEEFMKMTEEQRALLATNRDMGSTAQADARAGMTNTQSLAALAASATGGKK